MTTELTSEKRFVRGPAFLLLGLGVVAMGADLGDTYKSPISSNGIDDNRLRLRVSPWSIPQIRD